MSEVQDLLEEFHALETDPERINKEEVWQEINENIIPSLNSFPNDTPTKGERRGQGIYDGTPQAALQTYKSGLMGRLLSSYFNWFSIRTPDEDLMDVREVRMWLSKADQAIYGLIARSNFYPQIYEFFGVGGSIGHATLYRYWNAAQAQEVFLVQHPRSIYIAENEHGEIDTTFNLSLMTYKKMAQAFKNDTLHPDIQKGAEGASQKYTEVKVIHAVKPNPNYDPKKRDNAAKRYLSWYIDVEHENIIRKSGYPVMPYASWEVEKESDEVYGRGPGWRSLADVKALYAYAKTDIEAAQYMVNPAADIPEERRGKVKLVPGGRNYYEEAGRDIKPIDKHIDLRAGLERELKKQAIIEKHFMVPFFTMMQNVGEMTRERTAYEIRRIEEETAVLLGPHITGLNQNVMDKLIDGLFSDAWDAGLIPPPPQQLLDSMKGRRLEVDYMGPLALAQRSYFQAEPYRKSFATIGAIADLQMKTIGTAPVLDNYNIDRMSREMNQADGLPEEAMYDERQVARMRQQRAKELERQKQLAAMEQMGKAMPGLNQQVQKGSVADELNQQRKPTPA
jgi:hypothetical protein